MIVNKVYFQRVLSSKSAAGAELISYIAAGGCIFMAIPSILIGGLAKATRKNFYYTLGDFMQLLKSRTLSKLHKFLWKKIFLLSTLPMPYVILINKSLFWRIKSLDMDKINMINWSQPKEKKTRKTRTSKFCLRVITYVAKWSTIVITHLLNRHGRYNKFYYCQRYCNQIIGTDQPYKELLSH